MELNRKITANLIIVLSLAPCLLVFNTSGSAIYNVIGLIYGFLLIRYGSHFAPRVVREYFREMDKAYDKDDTYYN